MKRLLLLTVLTLSCHTAALPPVRDGDIIFHTSRSSQSVAIQRATGSPYSHMGVVLFRNGKPYVLEAIATVQYTPLGRWIERGTGHHFVVKRLKGVLTPEAVVKLRAATQPFLGRRYDLTFEWSDTRVYCSELVWKLYDRALGIQIGHLQKIKEFNLTDPAVRAKMHERYGDHIPTEEPVISPVTMFNSPLLETGRATVIGDRYALPPRSCTIPNGNRGEGRSERDSRGESQPRPGSWTPSAKTGQAQTMPRLPLDEEKMPIKLEGLVPLVAVFDMPTSVAFYRDVLGFVVVNQSGAGDDFGWGMLRLDDAELMLNTAYDEDERPAAPDPSRIAAHEDTTLYFGCRDVDAAYEHLLAKGIDVKPPKVSWYGMKQLYVKDPDGYLLCFQWSAA